MIARVLNALTRDDGMTTAEYAVGTVAAASLGGILLKLLTSSTIQSLLMGLLQRAFGAIFGG